MKTCDGTAVLVEGTLSTRAFSDPVNPYLSHNETYGRGVIRIDFASPQAPTSEIVEWLPLVKGESPANHAAEILEQ